MNEIQWSKTQDEGGTNVTAIYDAGSWALVGMWRIASGVSPSLAPMIGLQIAAREKQAPAGITTTVMRECEPHIRLLLEAYKQAEVIQGMDDPLERLHEKAKSLAARSPRGDSNYGSDLLALKIGLEAAGESRSVKELVRLLELPEGTVKTRLRAAQRGHTLVYPSDMAANDE